MSTPLDQWKLAVERGDCAAVHSLFTAHPELSDQVNAQLFSFDSSAIFCARQNLELVDLLLEHGADINQKTGWGAGGFGILEDVPADVAQPLIERGAIVDIWAAVSLNDMERARTLLDKDPSLVTSRGGDGKHPLHYARDVEMIDFLVGRGADVNARCIDHGSTPLQYLISDRDIVCRLLDHGAEPDIFVAAYWGSIPFAEQSIDADPDCCNDRLGQGVWSNLDKGDIYKWTIEHDVTPFQVARERGHNEFVDFITQHASPETRMTDAIWQGDRDAVDAIGTEVKGTLEKLVASDDPALARAAWWYNPPAVKLMLELGFDPHQVGVHDSTPLDRAAFHGYADIVELLLELDENPPIDRTNEFGGTPLGACLYGINNGWATGNPQDHVKTTRLLIEAGSTVSERYLGWGNDETDAMIRAHLAADGR